jgi:hypothetical protein
MEPFAIVKHFNNIFKNALFGLAGLHSHVPPTSTNYLDRHGTFLTWLGSGDAAVGFRVDSLNRRSQCAVERLGAKLEGVIRNYSILPNGNIRDMNFYSILPHEWPHIKANLNWLFKNNLFTEKTA